MHENININNSNDHDTVMKVISKGSKPNAILRLLMNAFESYRQARKMGWSRPWNKVNLMNFQSFRLNKERDHALIALAGQILNNKMLDAPSEALDFVNSLLNPENKLMGFVFSHEFTENGELYEGATLSLGRVNEKRHRDRLDIIVESKVVDGVSQGFSRMRIFVDPFEGNKPPLWTVVSLDSFDEAATELFSQLSQLSNAWEDQDDKHWNHWTSDYIDYFGPRQYAVSNSYFHQENSFHTAKVANG